MALRMRRRGAQIGEILVSGGHLTDAQLKQVLKYQKELGQPLGRILVEKGYVTEPVIASALAKQLGLPYLDNLNTKLDETAVSCISEDVARRYLAVPIGFEGDSLVVALADPTNLLALDDLAIMTGFHVQAVVATEDEILRAIDRAWTAMGSTLEAMRNAGAAAMLLDKEGLKGIEVPREVRDDAPIVKFVNLMITQAVKDRASDIHVEPQENEIKIRFRIDGVLHEVMTAPRKIHSGVISRLKIMADMDIAERRVPLDGRCSLTVEGKTVDLRVASAPTVNGEEIVMRILDKTSVLIEMDELGIEAGARATYEASFRKPHGAILVTGPTGAGKTTTLYATLNALNDASRKIITVEDPVEYRLVGVNQIQTNPKAGLTFARGLRSILRLDPDVVMVGEIRDTETAKIAVEASLTGHLVLSTLHTNDAPGALTRLVEMGIEPFLIGSAVECVLAQRLVRRLCPHCKEEYQPSPELANRLEIDLGRDPVFHRPKGCNRCSNGYKGRLGIYEVMIVTEDLERLIVERVTTDDIRQTALRQGMRTLRQDGLVKAAAGLTSLEEVVRVTM